MAVYRDGKGWRVLYRYEDLYGKKRQTQKRGFKTKHDAKIWEAQLRLKQKKKLNMTLASFYDIYEADMKERLKENTWDSKSHIIRTKILPYLGNRKMDEIDAKDIIAWQNILLSNDQGGKKYSNSYLKTIHAQLSAIFNHAVNFYNLPYNPAQRAGSIGSERGKEMNFWTKEEYLKYADEMLDKPQSFYAFELLYWTGIREGELLALTPADFDFNKHTVSISKSYQRLKKQDIITSPKTPKSYRVINMPLFLSEEIQDYLSMQYEIKSDDRIFHFTKSYLYHEMKRGSEAAGVKRIRIHDLRHSHVSLLIEMGFSALAIAERVGHESIVITYRYAHLFPTKQTEMAAQLEIERTKKGVDDYE